LSKKKYGKLDHTYVNTTDPLEVTDHFWTSFSPAWSMKRRFSYSFQVQLIFIQLGKNILEGLLTDESS
jgi:hypothetical protein